MQIYIMNFGKIIEDFTCLWLILRSQVFFKLRLLITSELGLKALLSYFFHRDYGFRCIEPNSKWLCWSLQ